MDRPGWAGLIVLSIYPSRSVPRAFAPRTGSARFSTRKSIETQVTIPRASAQGYGLAYTTFEATGSRSPQHFTRDLTELTDINQASDIRIDKPSTISLLVFVSSFILTGNAQVKGKRL